MAHVLTVNQFSRCDIESFFERLDRQEYTIHPSELFRGKLLVSAFFTASLRTKCGFESAMHRLGGSAVSIDALAPRAGPNSEESLSDTIQVVSEMCDVIVLRSSDPRDVRELAGLSKCAIINGGNGSGPFAEHPIQALGDLYFMYKRFGSLLSPRILLVGSMNHRVIRSLLNGFAIFGRSVVHVAYPDEHPPVPADLTSWHQKGMTIERVEDISRACSEFDVVYHNGVPKGPNNCIPSQFKLTPHGVAGMRKGAILLHSLPRSKEYPEEIDSAPQSVFFEQARIGYHAKTQLLSDLLHGTLG